MTEENVLYGGDIQRLLEDWNVGQILYALLNQRENFAIVDYARKKEINSRQLLDKAIKLCDWFKNNDIKNGDIISINNDNNVEFTIITIAAVLEGIGIAPINPEYTPGELNHVLSFLKPKVIFCCPRVYNRMIKIMPQHKSVQKLVALDDAFPKQPSIVSYRKIVEGPINDEAIDNYITPTIDVKNTIFTILSSSGTTGLPKGVVVTQDNITNLLDIYKNVLLTEIEDLTEQKDRTLLVAPFFHSMGFMSMFLTLLYAEKTIILKKFTPKLFLGAIEKYKISRLILSPPLILILVKTGLYRKYDLSSITQVTIGAAALSRDLENEFKSVLKNATYYTQGYGMTELVLGTLLQPRNKVKVGSVGKIVPLMRVKVIDKNGRALGPNQEGELCFKGPLVMKGYKDNDEETKSTIDEDGWLHTGDVSYYDEEGYFYIVDRIKELIKYKGYQVAPFEIESLLIKHPAIVDAAVVGTPSADVGELPVAFVVKHPKYNVTAAQIIKYVADNLSPHKHLRGGVIFVPEIPRNHTGKILRRVLKDRIKHSAKL